MYKLIGLLAAFALYPANGETTFRQYVEVMFQTDSIFETLCLRKTNDSAQAQRMVAANIELQNCVNRYHDPQNFTNGLDQLTVERRKEFTDYNCAEFEEIKKCYIPFTRQMEVCLSEQDLAMAKTLIILEKEFAYICERDGANVIPMRHSNYSFCAGNLRELMENCSMPEWQHLRSKTLSTLTEHDCRVLHKLSSCFQNNITRCGAPLFTQLFSIRYRDIVRQTSCKETLLLLVSLGDASPLETRVVDGETAGRAQFPYQVTVTLKRHPLCGGVLVHERFFLTAAHCFFKGETPVPVDDLNVFYGSEKLFSKGKYNRVKTVHFHDQYDQQSFQYDLALVETRRNFEYSFTAQPVALATEPLADPSTVTVSGFGRTTEAGNTAFKLKYAQLTTLPADQCQDATGDGYYEGALCLDTTSGGGFCAGDYGGPAVFNETLVGVGSYTVGGRCEAGTPDVFVEVAHFSDWVQAMLDQDTTESEEKTETDSRHL